MLGCKHFLQRGCHPRAIIFLKGNIIFLCKKNQPFISVMNNHFQFHFKLSDCLKDLSSSSFVDSQMSFYLWNSPNKCSTRILWSVLDQPPPPPLPLSVHINWRISHLVKKCNLTLAWAHLLFLKGFMRYKYHYMVKYFDMVTLTFDLWPWASGSNGIALTKI